VRIYSERYIAETGGMPEITTAALQKTEDEILGAEIASRFPREPSEWFTINAGHVALSPVLQNLIAQEGEAGHKRGVLLLSCRALRASLMGLVYNLVLLRTDMITSQQEM
jgi:hypothetical protein